MPQRLTNRQDLGAGDASARGEPRRLLLDAARDLFARQDYRSTTTREIAEAAGVYRAPAIPQLRLEGRAVPRGPRLAVHKFVDEFGRTWQSVVPEETDEEELARQFVGQLYDVFVEHRGCS